MSNMIVKPVTTRREKKQFLNLPWMLYRDDPNWVPPLRMDQKEMVGFARHPFYAVNERQAFLALRDGEPCGRVLAIINHGHNERFDERRGFFGFFESVDDQEVADGLFEAVEQWFAQRDIHCLRGPCNPSLNYTLGLLVDGYDSMPTFMMTYNPPYYERLVEEYGFRKTQDLYAFWGSIDMLPKVQERWKPVVEQIIERLGIHLRPLNRKRFLEDVELFLSIYNKSLTNTWGFVPMSEAEVRHTAAGLRYLMVPEMAIAAEIDGKTVGAAFGLPDYNPRIKAIDGRLFPFGFLKLIRNKSAIKRVRFISANVLPEYQLHGVGLALMHGMVPLGLEWGLQEAEFSWVLESNSLSRGALEKSGTKRAKTYRLYDLDR